MNRFDWKLLRRLWAIAKPYWFSEAKWQGRGLLALVIVMSLGFNVLITVSSYTHRNMMNALTGKDVGGFYQSTLILVGVYICAIPISVLSEYILKKLGIHWRLWLTNSFLSQYFNNRKFYEIKNSEIDNPDQRISEDIKAFVNTILGYAQTILIIFINVFIQLGIIWKINYQLALIAFAVGIFQIIIMAFLSQRLIGLNFNQFKFEANFRYGLVHIREYSESIAFYRGEQQELTSVSKEFTSVVDNNHKIINWERNIGFFQSATTYIFPLLPYFVLANQYFAGNLDFGGITQGASAFNSVLGSLGAIASFLQSLTPLAATVNRLATFEEALSAPETASTPGKPTIDTVENAQIALKRVTVETPNYKRILVQDVSVEVPQGQGIIVVGPSGVGKSSLLRAIAGLWKAGTGCIVRPKPEDILFLPQRPYMVIGSLREQLLYPRTDLTVSNEVLQSALSQVNLADLPERIGGFDVKLEWADVLSLGEQQRLAFARLLLTNPPYAVLDESTSALDSKNEKLVYQLLKEAKTTFISVGHRPTILPYHESILYEIQKNMLQLVGAKGGQV